MSRKAVHFAGFPSTWVDPGLQNPMTQSYLYGMEEIRIGQVLKRLLRDQRKTLKQVSRDVNIPYSTLHTWYENRQPKDILKVQRLAEYLGITLHELLFDGPDKATEPPRPSQELPYQDDLFKGTFEIVVKRVEK